MNKAKCTLISFLGNSDIRGINELKGKPFDEVKKRKKKGPLLDIFPPTERIKPYDESLLEQNSIDSIIIIKEKNRETEETYLSALNQLEKWAKEKNIELKTVDFVDELNKPKKVVEYNDLFETFKEIITEEKKEHPNKPILINITSGASQIGTVATMLINDTKEIYIIESRDRAGEGTKLVREKEFKKIRDTFFQTIFSEILNNTKFKISLREPKKELFIKLATKYLTTKVRKGNPKLPFVAPLLLLGQTGTGKEVLTQSIVKEIRKKYKTIPFITLNCAVIPKDIIDSELFGYMKGSFTGANEDKEGVVEQANNGILFLDEFGELSLDAQAKLLRVLQNGKFRRVGDKQTEERKSFFVLIAATNRDLQKEIKAGNFREDLYYRVAKMIIKLPPLVEIGRKEIKKAGEEYLEKINQEFSQIGHTISPKLSNEIIDILIESKLPGNYRQLQTILFNAVIDMISKNPDKKDIELDTEIIKFQI